MPKRISRWLLLGWLIASVADYFLPHPQNAYLCDPISGTILTSLIISAAVSAATAGLQYLTQKKQKAANVDRGKVDDIRASVPGYGEFIPQIWSTARVAPIWMWETPAVDHPVTTPGHSGGKGLGGSPPVATTVDHVYLKSIAGVFHKGEIFGGVRRIWFDNDLVFNGLISPSFAAPLTATLDSRKYEAEYGILTGGAAVSTQSQCSGGKKVTSLGVTDTALLTSLISHWKLDELSGARADSYGSNNLTDNNTVTQAVGKISYGAQFTRANSEYLSKTDNASLPKGDIAFEFTAWVYLDTKSANMAILAQNSDTQPGYQLYYDSAADRFKFLVSFTDTTTATVTANNAGAPSVGTWYFILAAHDPVTDALYIKVNNGTADSQATGGKIPTSPTTSFTIGRDNFPAFENYWNGRIDEVSYWQRLLTVGEQTEIYNAGAGRGIFGDCKITITVPSTDDYVMSIHYTSSSALSFYISIDGAASVAKACASSGGSTIVAIETFSLGTLTVGDHTVTFKSVVGACPDLDCIDVAPARTTSAIDSRAFSAGLNTSRIPPTDQDQSWAYNAFVPEPGDGGGAGGATGTPAQSFNLGKYGQPSIRIYRGTTTQEADSAIIAQEGAAAASAYRGFGYLVIENLQLQNGRVPNVTLEVDQGVHSLPAIVADIYLQVGTLPSLLNLTQLAGLSLGDSDIDAGTYANANWQNKTNTTSAAGGAITKTSGADAAYNAGASHNASLPSATNGAIRFTASAGTFSMGWSLSASPTQTSDLLFGLQLHASDNASGNKLTLQTAVSGANSAHDMGIWAVGDVFQLEIRNGKFRAYQNGLELGGWTSPVATFPLYPAFIAYSSAAGVSAASVSLAGAIGDEPSSDAGGLLLSSRKTAADLLNDLMTRFQFDLVEVDGVVKAILRSNATSDITMPYTDMRAVIAQSGSLPEIPAFDCEIRDIDEYLLPDRVDVNYLDPAMDYHNNVQSEMNLGTERQDQQSVSLAIVDKADNMKALAITLMHKAEMEGRTFQWMTSWKYMHAHPGSIATLTLPNATHTVRITQAQYQLPAGVITWQGVRHAASVYSPTASGSANSGYEPPLAAHPANTIGLILDMPLLRAEDAGAGTDPIYYVAACGRGSGAWSGAFEYVENPRGSGNYELVTTFSQASQIGETTGALASVSDPSVWDRSSTLTINFFTDTSLSSVSEADLLSNPETNLICIQDAATGNVELVQFSSASAGVAVAPYQSRWTITTLLRGRNGTDSNVGYHSTGDKAVIADSTLKPRRYALADIGL